MSFSVGLHPQLSLFNGTVDASSSSSPIDHSTVFLLRARSSLSQSSSRGLSDLGNTPLVGDQVVYCTVEDTPITGSTGCCIANGDMRRSTAVSFTWVSDPPSAEPTNPTAQTASPSHLDILNRKQQPWRQHVSNPGGITHPEFYSPG